MNIEEFAEQVKQYIIEKHKEVGPYSPYVEGVGYRISFNFIKKDNDIFFTNFQLMAKGE